MKCANVERANWWRSDGETWRLHITGPVTEYTAFRSPSLIALINVHNILKMKDAL